MLGAAAGDDLPRRRDAHLHRAGRARAAARRPAGRGRGHRRGEPGDRDARARPGFCRGTVSTVCRWARRASSRDSRRARAARAAGRRPARRATFCVMPAFDNISLDLIYGIPGQTAADLDADLAEALALEPEHVSCYELEAKPGTRFTHAHGVELERQAESMESYFERVVAALTGRRLPLVRDGELLPRTRTAGISGPGTTSATGSGGTTSGSGSARSRRSRVRRRNAPRLAPLPRGARRRAAAAARARVAGRRDARAASGSCSGCGSTSRCSPPGSRPRSTARRSSGSNGSAWSRAPA